MKGNEIFTLFSHVKRSRKKNRARSNMEKNMRRIGLEIYPYYLNLTLYIIFNCSIKLFFYWS